MRLVEFPWVKVRVRCWHCPRRGSYALARLGSRFGPECDVADVLAALSVDCPRQVATRKSGLKFHFVCGIHLADVMDRRPPDLPS